MAHRVGPIDPGDEAEVALVAERMGDTLAEVLGEDRGRAMYSPEWLEDRVRFHLDPARCIGEVFVARSEDGRIDGHTIVRVEDEPTGPVGLFSTTYVAAEARAQGVANLLLDAGEAWMREQAMTLAATWTHPENAGLIGLYTARGYTSTPVSEDFVRLTRPL